MDGVEPFYYQYWCDMLATNFKSTYTLEDYSLFYNQYSIAQLRNNPHWRVLDVLYKKHMQV